MFLDNQNNENIDLYKAYLRGIASISRLFSDSESPYIPYRASENIFCLAFSAVNVSRTDCSADAMKVVDDGKNMGFGIKTFLEKNDYSFEKIAEFNRDLTEERRRQFSPEELVQFISHLRNRRLETTCSFLGLHELIYHCVVRSKGIIKIYEQKMDSINTENIILDTRSRHPIFNDGINEYEFNLTKSTLLKRFSSSGLKVFSFDVKFLDDPYELIKNLGIKQAPVLVPEQVSPPGNILLPLQFLQKPKQYPRVYLPLFSPRYTNNPRLSDGSGLNQWNAEGRPRDKDEVYIPIPLWIHRKFPNFFPGRDTPFKLRLPNLKVLDAKVCQSDGKALMSNPNNALGKWILRDILKIKEGVLVTYDDLVEIGIDSVEVTKTGDLSYEIDFKKIGTYSRFAEVNNIK